MSTERLLMETAKNAIRRMKTKEVLSLWILIVVAWVYQRYFWEKPLEIFVRYHNPSLPMIAYIWSVPLIFVLIIVACGLRLTIQTLRSDKVKIIK